ncbi:MAG: hypothetical protein KAH57_08180, partial [Thermoplasmata archaeon]|nr:hypothetical protein [Thermoplasmata archaeon]
NDNANDMLYIHPFKMKRKARAALKSGDVAMWDRTALAIAIGEAKIVDLEGPEPEEEEEAPGWFSGDADPDPVSELREFEKSIKAETEVTIGSFQVKKITMGGVETDSDANASPEVSLDPERSDGPAPPLGEVPSVSIEAIDMDLSVVLEEESVKELDVSPVFSMFDTVEAAAEGQGPSSGGKPPAGDPEDAKLAQWSRIPLAPKRISEAEAASLAGGDASAGVNAELRPHLLYSVRYVMETEDGASEVIQERPFLMDCTDGEVMDLPHSLAEELSNLKRSRPRNDKRPVITSRLDGPSAVENVRRKLMDLTMLRDEKVHDGPGSVIYEETRYGLRKGSLEVVGTFKVLMPYWVGAGENGDTLWAVEAHTGRLRHPQ